jgi:hypothetical protein
VPPKNILDEYRAPPWEPARSDFIVLWHGTLSIFRQGIENGISRSRCAVDTDFGQGFYTTTLERQARFWAWDRFNRWMVGNPTQGVRPVIMRFRVRRSSVPKSSAKRDRGLDSLNCLDLIRGGFDNDDYWSLVQHCRSSTPAGPNGLPGAVINDHKRKPNGWYDVVAGPVAAFWEQRVAMADADQYSFHTKAATRILDDLIATGLRAGPHGDAEHYSWEEA